ncbi:M24 family metallopeptidase [Desulfoscipio geothermicus]|uniref:Xaa-Pro aminopeptidase n=1 Tax=Desulfoscipio geothermicus DSM 3669 TaxID=1121426 RepID=A0A1I6CQY4_9FIRM|nr:Xaa-Pro peptidase family protein [Desulfoscipio geothermicus]SFQ95507.1 Xaa-Pro aminopeptidase [Desulfoscipio geothermicus DSM 3669]
MQINKNFNDNLLTPKAELQKRIEKLQLELRQYDLDGALIIQSTDLVYFTGTYQNAHLYIPVEGRPIIMVRRNIDRMKTDSKLDVPIIPFKSMSEIIHFIKQHNLPLPKRLGLEMDVLPVSSFLRYQKIFLDTEFFDCTHIIRKLRAIKSSFEISRIKETSKMMDKIFRSLFEIIRPGLSEFDLVGEIESVARREGHQGLIRVRGFNAEFYFGQLLTGVNSAITSYFDGPINGVGLYPEVPFGPGGKIIQRNEPILFDYVGAKSGYITDMTRTFVIGSIDSKLDKSYQVAKEIQQAIIQEAKPGLPAKMLYDLAYKIAKKYNLIDHFMGAPYPVSFIGHGIGLELNELPVLAKGIEEPLQEGMVFAIEPKFVFPGIAGVGLENTFILNKSGLEKLSSFPDDKIINI